jgi:hypothetical protein
MNDRSIAKDKDLSPRHSIFPWRSWPLGVSRRTDEANWVQSKENRPAYFAGK